MPSRPVFDVDDRAVVEAAQKFWDDISGEELPVPLVTAARKEEIDWVRSIRLYDKVPRSEMVARGHKALTVRWVDVNKGDRQTYKVRSRLVGREMKHMTKQTLLAHELFSAMPPWEMVKFLFLFACL